MRKNTYKKIFIILILILLLVPMLVLLGIKEPYPLQGDAKPKKPEVLFEGYEVEKFQKSYEKWFNRYFLGRNFLTRFKNASYYFGNFKYFVFKQEYFIFSPNNEYVSHRGHLNVSIASQYRSQRKNNLEDSFNKLAFIQREFEKRGKKFLFIMGANGIRLYEDKKAPYLKHFDNYYQINGYDIYREYLDKYKINYFDTQSFFVTLFYKTSIEPMSFLDHHWNRYGAGMVMVETLKQMKDKYLTDWVIPEIETVAYSSKPVGYYDIYGSQSLNLFFLCGSKNRTYPYLIYNNIVQIEKQNIKISLLGDSFTREYYEQILDSKFTKETSIQKYENQYRDRIPTNIIKKIIDDSDTIIIIFTELNFFNKRLNKMADSFYKYFQEEQKSKTKK